LNTRCLGFREHKKNKPPISPIGQAACGRAAVHQRVLGQEPGRAATWVLKRQNSRGWYG